ncbi:hypothetical protein Y032_0023g846 [Ancylostoma ceylanicum]|uniref:Uncharacterized protein n=1 Tax=Ancylostoma ceylanicum TaxID=53326 RepID=A0A016UXE7_9BILA|nr:hypothetical protein Y032_0023g846 [Ancylostoma ceylanicum]
MELYYIFNVARGHRFHVEVSPQWKVRQLQENIAHLTGIRIDDQVLLKACGEILDSEQLIQCNPSENNFDAPVYLFQRSSRQEKEDSRHWDQEINEITSIIDVSIENASRSEQDPDLHRLYLNIPMRARECRTASQSAIHACARFAEEHRLIHQGWMALVNNMDVSVMRLKKRAARFQDHVDKVRQQREKATELLQGFDTVIEQLKQIRIPGPLLAYSRGQSDRASHSDLSLYAWISASDPQHSLQDLVEQVKEQITNFGQSDAMSTMHSIEKVVELSKDVNSREIKGINKRLTDLDHHLRRAEERDKAINAHTSKIVETPSHIDQSALEELISEHRYLMSQIYAELRELRVICNRFYASKVEVLGILRTRLNSWIVRVYDRLFHAHNEVLVFEEKFTGLKQRLNLVRQIKEAPMMYATAVSEVVRRRTFHKEFVAWHSLHVDKCTALSDEESQIRAQFSAKMEKHFLRVLFHGLFDALPMFYVKSLPKFDESLGPIDIDHLRELRASVEDLKQYLKVTAPQVFFRLNVRDPSMPSPVVPHGVMRREESFFTADPAFSLSTLTRNFTSTNWLSTDDGMDSSPSAGPTLLMTKSPLSRNGSSSSLNMPAAPSLNQLSMLGEEDEGPSQSATTSIAKSAPIQIPTPQPRQVSEKSSQFSTPDDHFHTTDPIEERQFPVDDLTSRSQSFYEALKPAAVQILSLSKDMLDLRAELTKNYDFFKESFAKIGELTGSTLSERLKQVKDHYDAELASSKSEHQYFICELQRQVEEYNKLEALSREVKEGMTEELASQQKERERLVGEIAHLEEKVKTVRSETYKEGIIAMELEKNRLSTEYEEIIEGKDAQIRQLQKELEKKNLEITQLRSDPEGEAFRKSVTAEIRSELEKESKSKLDLLTNGINQKKEEECARLRKELEYEMRIAEIERNCSMKWLAAERDRLREYIIKTLPDGESVCKTVEDEIKSAVAAEQGEYKAIYGSSIATQTDISYPVVAPSVAPLDEALASQYGDMRESVFAVEHLPVAVEESVFIPGDAPASDSERKDMNVQTRISLRSMDRMVAIEDIVEGSTVLVIWNDRHNAYMLFSSSTYSHFVKESSVRRLGLATTLPNVPRRNWILGKVSHLDLCIIRKADNRYRLPLDTRVYRVDVEPLEGRLSRSERPAT